MNKATLPVEVDASMRGLAIAQRYMGFCHYIYPIVVNMKSKHRVFREKLLQKMFDQIELFHIAAKSNQISRLYAADAGLATLREFLRFASDPARRLLSKHQHEVAEIHLAETGAMLGAWINKTRKGRTR